MAKGNELIKGFKKLDAVAQTSFLDYLGFLLARQTPNAAAAVSVDEEPKAFVPSKGKRGRPRKIMQEAETIVMPQAGKRRGRPKKAKETVIEAVIMETKKPGRGRKAKAAQIEEIIPILKAEQPKKGRGRPKKAETVAPVITEMQTARRRGRPRKAAAETAIS